MNSIIATKIGRHSEKLILLFAVAVSMVFSSYLAWDADRVPYSPDEAGALFFSEHLADTGTLIWHSDLNEEYDVLFFVSRSMVDLGNYDYGPKYSLSYTLFLSLGQIDDKFLNLQALLCLFSALGVLAVYLLVREIFDRETALISSLFMAVLPPYTAFTNTFTDIVPTLVIYILSLYFFFKFINRCRAIYLSLAGIFFIFAAFLREANAPIYIAGYIPLLIAFRHHFRQLKVMFCVFLSTALAFLPFSLMHWILYGGFLTTGRTITESKVSEIRGAYVPFDLGDLSEVIYHHIIDILPVLLLGIIGMILALRLSPQRDLQKRTSFLISSLIMIITILVIYGSRPNLFGFGTDWLICSPVRYFLPIYTILAIYLAVFVRYLFSGAFPAGKMSGIALVIVLSASFCMLSFNPDRVSLPRKKDQITRLAHSVEVIQSLPLDAVIFTSKQDKSVFPSRQVGLVNTEDILLQQPMFEHKAPIVDIEENVIPVVANLLDDSIPVYVIPDAEVLMNVLRDSSEYDLVRMPNGWLHKVEQRR